MRYYLKRLYRNREWTIGPYDSVELATKAAHEHVAEKGHLYPATTRFVIEMKIGLGFVVGDKLVKPNVWSSL